MPEESRARTLEVVHLVDAEVACLGEEVLHYDEADVLAALGTTQPQLVQREKAAQKRLGVRLHVGCVPAGLQGEEACASTHRRSAHREERVACSMMDDKRGRPPITVRRHAAGDAHLSRIETSTVRSLAGNVLMMYLSAMQHRRVYRQCITGACID